MGNERNLIIFRDSDEIGGASKPNPNVQQYLEVKFFPQHILNKNGSNSIGGQNQF